MRFEKIKLKNIKIRLKNMRSMPKKNCGQRVILINIKTRLGKLQNKIFIAAFILILQQSS